MSLQCNRCLTPGIDIPWKAFVRETDEVIENPSDKKVHRLGFEGNEARVAYEEVVRQESNSNNQLGRIKCTKSKLQTQHNNSIKLSNTQSIGKQQPEATDSKVTINMILKAVEQKDLKFLLKHLTLDNVNLCDDFGWTPLMSAAFCGHFDIIEMLLSLGANRRAREKSGLTAAQLALKKNYLNIVALLRRKMENTNNRALVEPTIGVSKMNIGMPSPMRSESMEPLKPCHRCIGINIGHRKEQTCRTTRFYCEICETTFEHATPKKHESSTLHIFNTKPKICNAMYGISKQNKGYQMLLNTGWDEQGGLGPSGKGMKYPVKTCLKTDRKGVGQPGEKEPRVTHFKPGDTAAIGNMKICKHKALKKRDREKLLHREALKERAIRIALS